MHSLGRFLTSSFLAAATLSTLIVTPALAIDEVTAFAPGRMEIIGNHLDYNGGRVVAAPLQTVIDGKITQIGATVKLKPNADPNDKTVTIVSHTRNPDGSIETLRHSYQLGQEKKQGAWSDYFEGSTAVLADNGFQIPRGYHMEVTSDVPLGAGLSSSAAIEVAQLRAIRKAYGLHGQIDDVLVAKLGQKIENDFVGAKVGLMDQLTISLSPEGKPAALLMDFKDPAHPKFEQLPMPEGIEWVIVDSGVKHNLADDHGGDGAPVENFNTRRNECETALARINQVRKHEHLPELTSLSEVSAEMLGRPEVKNLPENLKARVRHVVTENQRVDRFVEELKANGGAADSHRIGQILDEAFESADRDYRITTPEIRKLIEIARANPDVLGARNKGGGFGGSVLLAVKKGKAGEVSKYMESHYAQAIAAMHAGNPNPPRGRVTVGADTDVVSCLKRELR